MKEINRMGLVLGLTSSTAFAHEGHGIPGTGNTLLHYFVQPGHALLFWLLVSTALLLLGLHARRQKDR